MRILEEDKDLYFMFLINTKGLKNTQFTILEY